jgi:hypothetical protein
MNYDEDRGPQSGGSPLPLVVRDIVWRAVFSFRARDIERGPWCLLLCAAVIRALLRARRISIVSDGGSRDQHDKGGRTYHRRSPSNRGWPGACGAWGDTDHGPPRCRPAAWSVGSAGRGKRRSSQRTPPKWCAVSTPSSSPLPRGRQPAPPPSCPRAGALAASRWSCGDDRRLAVVTGRRRYDSLCLARCAWLRCPCNGVV